MTTKDKASKFANLVMQGKESLKMLEGMIPMPNLDETKKQTNVKILAGLKNLGVATKTEMEELRSEIRLLRKEVARLQEWSRTALTANKVQKPEESSKSPSLN